LDGFFGTGYRFTTAKGYFSEQFLQSNKQYGFDPVLEYFDLYFPIKDGLNIRIGRFLSVLGIEAQLPANNYNLTHSLLHHRSVCRELAAWRSSKATELLESNLLFQRMWRRFSANRGLGRP
jgi:Putative beta-barrel porin-2, OmpL-like. bbp2